MRENGNVSITCAIKDIPQGASGGVVGGEKLGDNRKRAACVDCHAGTVERFVTIFVWVISTS